ncbi:PF14478 domain protein, partial [Streptococcus pyogenes GA06023]
KGDTVLEILKDNYEVKEKDGFITAIDGIEQDTKANKYWLFKVNGKMADKGADQITVKDGDSIEFYQEVFK